MRSLRDYAARRGWIVALQVREIGLGAPCEATEGIREHFGLKNAL